VRGAPGGDEAGHRGARPGRRAQTVLFAVVLVVLVVGTAAGVVLGRQRALEDVEQRARRTGQAVAAVLEVEIEEVSARLAGIGAVVAEDGTLDTTAFAAFASDSFDLDRPDTMVLVEAVAPADRAAFEERLGAPIREPELGFVPSPERPVHYVVVANVGGRATRSIEGVDLAGDPTRLRAIEVAATEGRAALSAPLTLVSTGRPGVAVVRPIAGGDGTVRGFVTMGINAGTLADIVGEAVPTSSDVVLLDGDQVLVGVEDDDLDLDARQVVPVDVPDRAWTVAVRPGAQPDFTVTWILAAAGSVAIATVSTLFVLTERHHRRLARTNALLARSQERSRAVQDVSGRLARALTGDDVASAVIDHVPAAVGGTSAAVATMDRRGQLEVLVPGGEPRALTTPAAGSVVERVLSLREAAWLASPLGWRGDPIATELASGASALAVLPLLADDVAGVLVVAYGQLHIFEDEEQALLQTVGVLAGQALARGRRYDAEHQAAVAFQRAALPDALPVVPGLSVAARYRPAVHGATVGGDWYDAIRLDDQRLLLVVGDVVGHGMTAAAAMGRLRTAFQSIVPYRGDPGSLLQGVSQQVDAIPDAFCTTVVSVVIDASSGELSWSRAGHPPPLVVSSEGATRLLDAPCLPPLGVAPDQQAPVHHERLAPGEVLVLYTDGIVERREESLDQGFRRLALVAEQLVDLDVEELADALVEAMVPAEDQADDLAVLVVRADAPASAG
jgi:serine phosphatase RsbU (regulator of sigma subunit)